MVLCFSISSGTDPCDQYSFVLSDRLGRSSSKEQYAFFYRWVPLIVPWRWDNFGIIFASVSLKFSFVQLSKYKYLVILVLSTIMNLVGVVKIFIGNTCMFVH